MSKKQGARCATRAHGALVGALLFLLVGMGGCTHGGGPRAASVANAIEADMAQGHLERESRIDEILAEAIKEEPERAAEKVSVGS